MSDPQLASYHKILSNTEFDLVRLAEKATRGGGWQQLGGGMVALELVHSGRQMLEAWDRQPSNPDKVDQVTVPPPDPSGLIGGLPHRPAAELLEAALADLLELLSAAADSEDRLLLDRTLPAVLRVDRARRAVSGQIAGGRGGAKVEPPAPMPPDPGS